MAVWNFRTETPRTFEELFPPPPEPGESGLPWHVQEAIETAKKIGKPIPGT